MSGMHWDPQSAYGGSMNWGRVGDAYSLGVDAPRFMPSSVNHSTFNHPDKGQFFDATTGSYHPTLDKNAAYDTAYDIGSARSQDNFQGAWPSESATQPQTHALYALQHDHC